MKKEGIYSKDYLAGFKTVDRFFIELTIALLAIGIIFAVTSSTHESYRLTKSFFTLGFKQLVALVIGLFSFFLFSLLNYRTWFRLTWQLAWAVLAVMVITVFSGVGKASGGSQRWIDIGFFQFQPSECVKFAVVLLVSRFLTKYKWMELKKYYYLVFSLVLILMILKQPDLGSATILALLILLLFFLFGYPLWILALASALSSYVIYLKILSIPYQLDRLKFFLNPYLEPQGRGYNLIQAKYTFAFGGLFGVGLGNSIQKQGYLPVPHSDFIFAVIAEEIGFVGATAILILYITWILRGLYLMRGVHNKYGKILGVAIISLIAIQAIMNISVAVGLLPITGVTLPFFSCGGTSLIVTLAMCGILFNILSSAKVELY